MIEMSITEIKKQIRDVDRSDQPHNRLVMLHAQLLSDTLYYKKHPFICCGNMRRCSNSERAKHSMGLPGTTPLVMLVQMKEYQNCAPSI